MPSSNGPLKGTRGKLSNDPRERGASPPQRAIQEYDIGQKVHLKIDPSVSEGRFHPRFNGHTGTVVGTQGRAFKVEINDGGKDKTLITRPAHLTAQQ
ncbi:50S ribosomal protein L21e [Haloplanus salinus]|jgi:large subunit ribosomal protein L21e|uniref:Large ribosomal subunit protein eL21 n=1 Tax=Haloplanus salinus TaxID=1126245 RepID=A0A368NE85_9EURY|nr:50S ribosomal protein L21e [Haloplanus salinus]RCU48410.1 50S ribosomal protein L21e [Haloplanus salinus]